MTISSSLTASVAGLQVNATRLASISDNIANSGTYGYRRVETDFSSLVLGGDSGDYTAGGVNATSRRLIDERGSLVTTNNATDIAISGGGFIPVTNIAEYNGSGGESEILLASTGSFRINSEGFLANDSGYYLMGWPALSDGTIPGYPRDTGEGLEPVQFSLNLRANPTSTVDMVLNLPATDTEFGSEGVTRPLAIEYFDNLGTSQSLSMSFIPTVASSLGAKTNEWTMIITDSSQADPITGDPLEVGNYTIQFGDGSATSTEGGTIASVVNNSGDPSRDYDPTTGSFVLPVLNSSIEVDIGAVGTSGGLSQLSNNFQPIAVTKDGSEVGNMVSVDIDRNGMVSARFDSGVTEVIYQVPLVSVPNPNGLSPTGEQTYRPSNASGAFFLWDAGDGPTGEIRGFAREESTTDVAGELTDMIKTQRAYSSNAKVIQTVDEMLQETTNIKR